MKYLINKCSTLNKKQSLVKGKVHDQIYVGDLNTNLRINILIPYCLEGSTGNSNDYDMGYICHS